MGTNISIVQGVTSPYDIDLVDSDGESYPLAQLADASAVLDVKVTAGAAEAILQFTTADNPTRIWFDEHESVLHLKFEAADTNPLEIGMYTYRIRVTLSDGTIFDAIPWSTFDLNLGGSASTPAPVFENTVQLDHNYGLADDLRYVTAGGAPIASAQIRVYYRSEYNAGVLTSPVGVTQTDANGRWANPILVHPGYEYVVQFFKPNEFGPNIAIVTA